MKALTLTQPWATLVAIGAKRIETRSWHTTYRGPLAIHAAKRFPADAKILCLNNPFHTALYAAGCATDSYSGELPLGCVLAICRLVACTLTSLAFEETLTEQERAFGNYAPGRFAWVLEDVQPLPKPIPALGSLGIWEWKNGCAA